MTFDPDDPNDPAHPDHDLSESMPYSAGRPARPLLAPRWVFLLIAVLVIAGLLLPMIVSFF